MGSRCRETTTTRRREKREERREKREERREKREEKREKREERREKRSQKRLPEIPKLTDSRVCWPLGRLESKQSNNCNKVCTFADRAAAREASRKKRERKTSESTGKSQVWILIRILSTSRSVSI